MPTGTPFSETATFVINEDGSDYQIAGFDSVLTKMEFSKTDVTTFGIIDTRSTADTRLNTSGNFTGDTLKMTGSYNFLDRSRRQFRFVGVKK